MCVHSGKKVHNASKRSSPFCQASHTTFETLRAGKSNGVQMAWVNGHKVFEDREVLYRTNEAVTIDKFALHGYHGGADSRFAPDQSQDVTCASHALRNQCHTRSCQTSRPRKPSVSFLNVANLWPLHCVPKSPTAAFRPCSFSKSFCGVTQLALVQAGQPVGTPRQVHQALFP